MRSYCFNSEAAKGSRGNGDIDCTTVWLHLMPLNCTLNMVKWCVLRYVYFISIEENEINGHKTMLWPTIHDILGLMKC